MGEKYKLIDNEEKVLKYLYTFTADKTNQFLFNNAAYERVENMTGKEVAQTLNMLEDRGYIKIQCLGQRANMGNCYITITEAGLTYFEDQNLDEENLKDDRRHNYKVAIISGISGTILGYLLNELVQWLETYGFIK